MAQSAILDRYDNNLKVASMNENARMQNAGMYDELIGHDMAENQNIHAGNVDRFNNYTMPMYLKKLQNAQALGATGRQNLYNTLETMPYKVGNLTNQYAFFNQQRRRPNVAPVKKSPANGPYMDHINQNAYLGFV
jgi:hypothetical protein